MIYNVWFTAQSLFPTRKDVKVAQATDRLKALQTLDQLLTVRCNAKDIPEDSQTETEHETMSSGSS